MEHYNQELVEIKDTLKAYPRGMTVKELSETIKLNRNSVAKYLDILLVSGHVDMRAVGPAKIYFFSHRVPLSAMLNFTSDYMLVLDKDLKVVQMNDLMLKFMKAKREELAGLSAKDSPHPLFAFPWLFEDLSAALGGKELTKEVSFRDKRGEFHFRMKMVPTTFDDGEPGVTILLEDITEHKKMEEDLQVKNNAVASSVNAIVIADLDCNLTYVNDAFMRLWGYDSRKDVLGKRATKFWDEEDKAEEVMDSLKKRGGWIGEMVAKRKDEYLFDVQVSASIVKNGSGSPFCLMASFVDITERKKTRLEIKEREEKYRKIFELSPEAILLLDRKGTVVEANGRLYDWLSYKPEEIIGRKNFDLPFLSKESKAKVKETFPLRMRGEEIPPYEVTCIDKDGKKGFGLVTATLLRDDNGEVTHELVMVSNLTEHKYFKDKARTKRS